MKRIPSAAVRACFGAEAVRHRQPYQRLSDVGSQNSEQERAAFVAEKIGFIAPLYGYQETAAIRAS